MARNPPTVKDVFDRAHEIPSAAERQAYLEEACAGDPDLRAKVEALLRAHDEAGSFLEQPAVPAPGTTPDAAGGGPQATGPYQPGNTPPEESFGERDTVPPRPDDGAPPDEGPGTRLGPYRLLEEIGHGGMGAVYLAEQEQPVRRRVALKIIKPGMDSAQVVARFGAERQALALMDHLNIARVLDAGAVPSPSPLGGEGRGEGGGRPYFVMELVQGVPITRFCDEQGLTVRERLELFVPVCQAIQHAHQKGVIHRDIKPSNVLVTLHEGKPFPKVIDFGIAKAIGQPLTEQSPHTQVGTLVGTLEYMSPEQADLLGHGVDTRSDVYSLGVLLYELLTGTTPLDRARLRNTALVEVLRLIVEEEPPRCSTRVSGSDKQQTVVAARRQTEPARLARLLRGDLDWIAAKALEKDRNRRYETAAGLARDVQRYLADEPVEARPPSAGYRLGKFVRKHRALVAAAGGVVAVLVLAVVGLTAGMIVVNQERQRAVAAEKQTHTALDTTDAVFQVVLRKGTKFEAAEKAILRKILQDYRLSAPGAGNGQQARVLRAEAEFRRANLAALIEERAEAEAGYRRAIQLYEGLASEFPGVMEHRKELARACFNLGFLLEDMKNLAEAEAALRRAVGLHEKLMADFPTNPAHRSDLADDLNDLGVVLSELRRPEAAEEAYRRAIDLGKKLVADFPDFLPYRTKMAASYGNLGNVVRDQGQPAAALPWYGEVIKLIGPVVAQGRPPADAQLILRNAHWDRANALGQLGRHAEAVEDWQRAFDLAEPSDRRSIRLFQETARVEERLKAIAPGANDAASGSRFYAAARVFAPAAAEAVAKNEERLGMHYARRALELLEQARAAGFFRNPQRIEELKKDSYLKALGQRPEFQKFVAGLEAGQGPK